MSDTGWFVLGAVGGAAVTGVAGYLVLLWYFTRNNPL